MKTKNKIRLLAYAAAAIPVVGAGLVGLNIASAHGLGFFGSGSLTPDQIAVQHQTMFQNEADLLGISVDEIKNGWAQGKTIAEIAQEHGITQDQLQQKIKDARTSQIKSQLQTLVDKGIITQAQADQRIQFVQNNQNGQNRKLGRGFRWGF